MFSAGRLQTVSKRGKKYEGTYKVIVELDKGQLVHRDEIEHRVHAWRWIELITNCWSVPFLNGGVREALYTRVDEYFRPFQMRVGAIHYLHCLVHPCRSMPRPPNSRELSVASKYLELRRTC